jgi:thymidylate kinase
MIIILEGVDGVGKTTLADAADCVMRDMYAVAPVRMKSGPPDPDMHPFDQYIKALTTIIKLAQQHKSVIMDRFHVGELVYGNALRTTDFATAEAAWIDMVLIAAGAQLVYCHLEYDKLVDRVMHRDGDKPDKSSGASLKHSRLLARGYNAFCGSPDVTGTLPGTWNHVDTAGHLNDTARSLVVSARMAAAFGAHRNFVGSVSGSDVVFVHENPCIDLMVHIINTVANITSWHAIKSIGFWCPESDLSVLKNGARREPDMAGKVVIALTRKAVNISNMARCDVVDYVYSRQNESAYDSALWTSKMEEAYESAIVRNR